MQSTLPELGGLDGVRARPGGRSAQIRAAVRAAAEAELLEKGYQGLSHRQIAARAGVDATTVYRRWPSRARLVADLLLEMSDARVPVPDTGRLADDLTAYLGQITVLMADSRLRPLMQALSSASAEGDAEVTEALSLLWTGRFARAAAMLERAAGRGEITLPADRDAVIETLVAPAWFRLLVSGQPLDEPFIHRCVTTALGVLAQSDAGFRG